VSVTPTANFTPHFTPSLRALRPRGIMKVKFAEGGKKIDTNISKYY
jgi:hypothetical protein